MFFILKYPLVLSYNINNNYYKIIWYFGFNIIFLLIILKSLNLINIYYSVNYENHKNQIYKETYSNFDMGYRFYWN